MSKKLTFIITQKRGKEGLDSYSWHLIAGNGERVANSPMDYTRKANCLRQMEKMAHAFRQVDNPKIVDVFDESTPKKRGPKVAT